MMTALGGVLMAIGAGVVVAGLAWLVGLPSPVPALLGGAVGGILLVYVLRR